MSPFEGMVEEFFQTLATQNNLPPNESHIHAGDNNSHVPILTRNFEATREIRR